MDGAAPIDSGDLSVAALGPDAQKSAEKPRVSTPEEAAKLAPGSTFIGPDEKEHAVPYKVDRPEQIANIPDGADFIGPDGKLRQKPKYEGIDFTAQTLYDMGVNDKERKRALERSYPGKVRDDPSGGFYVEDDDGVHRKPGRGLSRVTGGVASAAAPTILSVLGALGGGAAGAAGGAAAGSAVPVAGTLAGGISGGTTGAALGGAFGGVAGTMFNDLILGLAGVYDRTPGEEFTEEGLAFLGGGAGAGVGRGISTVVPSIKTGLSAASAAAPSAMRAFAGIKTPEQQANLATARGLMERGVAVGPSTWAPELPHVHNIVEVFDPAFHTNQPLLESATAHYEKSAGEILDTLGIKDPGSLTKPIAAVPTKEAGELIMRRTLGELADSDANMRAALEAKKTALPGQEAAVAQRESVLQAAEEARTAAQKVIDAGYKDIESDIKTGLRVAEAGHNSGDLWGAIGEKLMAVRRAVGARMNVMVSDAHEAAGGHLPNIEGLPETADQFLQQLPPDFQSKYPDIVRKLRDLAGVKDEKTGEWVKEPFNPGFAQLHNMRTQMRNNINYLDLTPDTREGVYKFFAGKLDRILHDADAVPELQEASRLLKAADKWYSENIKLFNAQQVKAVMKGLEAGEPADPQNLYNVVVKSGQTDLTQKIKEKVGPNLWAGVKAADMQSMLDASQTLTPGIVDGRKFAQEVLSRVRNNTLEVVHGKEASEKLIEQARRISMLNGTEPIPVRPGDTVTQVIARARQAEELAKAEANRNPLATLNKEMRKIEIEHQKQVSKMIRERRKEPLGYLYDLSFGANEAVDKTLGSEDLILAAAAKFGEDSPEFNALRQVWAQRILMNSGPNFAEKLGKHSAEIQQLMFPGVSLNQARTLAKEMDFILGAKAFKSQGAGSSMSAFAKVEHPTVLLSSAALGFHMGGPAGAVVGLATGAAAHATARMALGAFFGTMRQLMNKPALLRWLEKGLNGSPADREAVRQSIAAVLQKGGAVGAGAGEATVQGSGPQ